MTDDEWHQTKELIKENIEDISLFMTSVYEFFSVHSSLKSRNVSVIHSLKKRLKDDVSLRAKIERKIDSGRNINLQNFFEQITDLAGVRLLLLFQNDFSTVDTSIRSKLASGDWSLHERPKAFTWDPEAQLFFQKFELDVQNRDTSYTSVHYVLKPRNDSLICCEVQVRTLFEEIWGEIDHRINYPIKTKSETCREQLMVLSKIVGAGSRLADSIHKSISNENSND